MRLSNAVASTSSNWQAGVKLSSPTHRSRQRQQRATTTCNRKTKSKTFGSNKTKHLLRLWKRGSIKGAREEGVFAEKLRPMMVSIYLACGLVLVGNCHDHQSMDPRVHCVLIAHCVVFCNNKKNKILLSMSGTLPPP